MVPEPRGFAYHAYYSRDMAPARLRTPARRPRRGSLERPLDTRLVRAALLVVVPPLLLVLFTVARPGALPAPALPPAFDGETAAGLAGELAGEHPSRVPGSAGALGAATWFEEKLALYGIDVDTDRWRAEIPDLGTVELRNLAVVVPGATPETIVVTADRDTAPPGVAAPETSTGTASLVELARAYADPATEGRRARPQHTLVFLSADGGEYGSAGAERFATTSAFRGRILAVVGIDALAGTGVRLELSGDRPRSPAPALVRTAMVRVEEQLGRSSEVASPLRQLIDLGLPFGYGSQAPFLGEGISALRLAATGTGDVAAAQPVDEAALARGGRAVEALLGSLDQGVELASGTPAAVYAGDRVVRGWAIALVLIALVVPFVVGLVDLLAHTRRRGLRLVPAYRALVVRCAFWLWLGALLLLAGPVGVLPDGIERPLPPHGDAARDWPVAGLLALAVPAAAGWLVVRRTLRPVALAGERDELPAQVTALSALAAISIVFVLLRPYALLFVAPSLYAWLFLVQATRSWTRGLLFALGFAGPVAALLSLATRFDLGIDAPLYVAGLVSVGYFPAGALAALLVWMAAASQLGAVLVGRYVPVRYSAEGALRTAARRALVAAQARRR